MPRAAPQPLPARGRRPKIGKFAAPAGDTRGRPGTPELPRIDAELQLLDGRLQLRLCRASLQRPAPKLPKLLLRFGGMIARKDVRADRAAGAECLAGRWIWTRYYTV